MLTPKFEKKASTTCRGPSYVVTENNRVSASISMRRPDQIGIWDGHGKKPLDQVRLLFILDSGD
jgi:hypothetical protein